MESLKYQPWVKKWDLSNSLYTPSGGREFARLLPGDMDVSGAVGADTLRTRSTPCPPPTPLPMPTLLLCSARCEGETMIPVLGSKSAFVLPAGHREHFRRPCNAVSATAPHIWFPVL